MGTPHDGADAAKLALTIANIANSVTVVNTIDINLLQRGSESLVDISRKFGYLAQNLKVVTVVESNNTPIPYLGRSIQASIDPFLCQEAMSESTWLINLDRASIIGETQSRRS